MLTTNLSNVVKFGLFGLFAGATEIEMRAKSLFLWWWLEHFKNFRQQM